MAHIADFMIEKDTNGGCNHYIAAERSPSPQQDAVAATEGTLPPIQAEEKEKYVWRMHQPTEARKYQLFPAAKDRMQLAPQKHPDTEMPPLVTLGATGNADKAQAQALLGAAARAKMAKEQAAPRRRKVSVPEVPTPMTTVQEVAMDSPTIPGRPPLHERSISAPGNSWRQHVFGESILSCISGPLIDEHAETELVLGSGACQPAASTERAPSRSATPSNAHSRSKSPKQPLSPKTLAPLVIPSASSQRLHQPSSASRLRSGSGPPDVPPKASRTREGGSPYPRPSPYTPMSASSTSLLSASTAPTSAATTPNSAFPPLEGRSSPKPSSSTPTLVSALATTPISTSTASPMCHSRGQSSDSQQYSFSHPRSFPVAHVHAHRRHESESGASIMDRGRPKKRSETIPSSTESPMKRPGSRATRSPSNPSTSTPSSVLAPPQPAAEVTVTTAPKPKRVEEQKAFEHLPTGHRPCDVPSHIPPSEMAVLRKQALGQASRFQVLRAQDVEALSRELRALDERCEYLRKTHRSLRSGRRNLHDRMCSYLRSPRTAKFSQDSMLKQEEALKELDTSIDDWVSKLEHAENRRMRVRQKLLEHVAAAVIMSPTPATSPSTCPATTSPASISPELSMIKGQQHIVTTMALALADPNTPPRSPTKSQSPERHVLERVVEGVKFPTSTPSFQTSSPRLRTRKLSDAESIRIYADSDVYALLADVEEEIGRMGQQETSDAREVEAQLEAPAQTVETKMEVKKEEAVLSPGIRLHAVAFEGMASLASKRSFGQMKVQESA